MKLPIKRQGTRFPPPARHCLTPPGPEPGQGGRATAAPAQPWVGSASIFPLSVGIRREREPPPSRALRNPLLRLRGRKARKMLCFGVFYFFYFIVPPLQGLGKGGGFLILKLNASAPPSHPTPPALPAGMDGCGEHTYLFPPLSPSLRPFLLRYPFLNLPSSFPLFKAQISPFLAPSPPAPPARTASPRCGCPCRRGGGRGEPCSA